MIPLGNEMNNKNTNEDRPKLSAEDRQKMIKQNISSLTYRFKDAVEKYKTRTGDTKNVRGTVLHGYQTDFAYALYDLQRGPIFFSMQYSAEASSLIDRLNSEQKKTA